MSRFVISEGENDLLFMRQTHFLTRDDKKFDTFNNEEADTSQTSRLTQHKAGDICDILYKSEGGIDKLIDIFAEISVDTADQALQMAVLVDLDGRPLEQFVSYFNDRIDDEMEINTKITIENVRRNQEFVFTECGLLVEGSKMTTFEMMAFYDDLEIAANIHDGDDKTKKIEKINKYISEKYIEILEFCEWLYG